MRLAVVVVLATAPYPLSLLVVILVGGGVVDIVRFQVYKLVYPASRGPSGLEQIKLEQASTRAQSQTALPKLHLNPPRTLLRRHEHSDIRLHL